MHSKMGCAFVAFFSMQKSKKEGDIYDTAELSDEIDYLPEWKISAGLEFNLPYRSVLNIAARYVGERQAIYAYSSGWPAQQHFKLVTLDAYITARGFEKAFDIAWISMSPAVQTAPDFERMESCARKWCVYIGRGRKRKNALMEEVFRLHDIQYGPPPGVGAAYDILVRSGRTPSLDYFETSWEWKGPAEDALEDIVCFIEMQDASANRDLIKKTLDRHERDGLICHTTYVEEGILVWPVDLPISK